MSAATVRRPVGYLFHPNHAAGLREFVVAVRRDGVESTDTVWARDWFDAWSDAVDEHGHDCRIVVSPL